MAPIAPATDPHAKLYRLAMVCLRAAFELEGGSEGVVVLGDMLNKGCIKRERMIVYTEWETER